LAKFGAILRENSNDLDKLSTSIISELIRYIDAKQAGFFIIREEKSGVKYIEQIASFAYGRKKFTDKRIEWGEGLIGACILEKESIFLEHVTETYIEITSGLGKANPRCIHIVHLKTQEGIIHGAIEIASFKVFEEYERKFIEQVAESIASTITTLKNNIETARLLDESRAQAKELAEHENAMRKTLEEMSELQMEAAKQSEEFVSFTNSVNHTMIRAEYTKDGVLQYSNTKFLEILGYSSNSEVEGKYITEFISAKDRTWFDEIWERLIEGGKHFEGDMKHVTKEGKDVWTIATYVSVRDQYGNPEKILFLGIDTTEAKKQSLDYEGQINALNHSSLKAEYLTDGKIIEYNQRLYETIGITAEDVKDKSIFDFIPADELNIFKSTWANIVKGIPFEGRIRRKNTKGDYMWFYGTYSVVRNMYDEIAKIIFIGSDITEQYLMEIKNNEQTLQLRKQEEELKESKVELSRKLHESREEMKNQFREIETVKLLHEKTLEGMLDAIITINQDNNIEFFNKAAEELWGYNKESVLGRNISVVITDLEEEFDGEYIGEFFKSNIENVLVNTRKEVFIVDKHGEQIFVLMTLSEAGIGLRYRLTAFIQRIEVELF
jgi:PAS domain S-box-containing protein